MKTAMVKKAGLLAVISVMAVSLLAGCKSDSDSASGGSSKDSLDGKRIHAVTREEGSGTRGAFIELFGVEVKNADGTKTDQTSKDATVANSTNVVMTNVANDKAAIGYISLGSLNDTIKAIQIDGVDATDENVKNGSYKIQRPFNIVTKGDAKGLAKDFIDFILSADGQNVVANGYIKVADNAAPYAGTKPSGKIVVAGSSSVTPIMEKLVEAYQKINPNGKIEVQMSDSTTGINSAIAGTSDIGMASRELKDEEAAKLVTTQIAIDGIAVIVNKKNPVTTVSADDIKAIYTGQTTKWAIEE